MPRSNSTRAASHFFDEQWSQVHDRQASGKALLVERLTTMRFESVQLEGAVVATTC